MSDKTVEQIDAEIKKLQDAKAEVVRLNEAKKPMFGDYGVKDGEGALICHPERGTSYGTNNEVWLFSRQDLSWGSPKSCVKLGNIFDDLEAAGPDGILLPLTKEEAEYVAARGAWYDERLIAIRNKAKAKLK